MGQYDYQRLTKQPGESEIFTVVFTNLGAGETIASVDLLEFSPATTPALTLGSPLIVSAGNAVQVRISEGKDGTVYKGTIRVTTTTPNVLEGDVKLVVKER